MPADASCVRAAAMARRLLQLGVGTEPMVTVASLGVLRDLYSVRRMEIKPLLHSTESRVTIAEDEGQVAEEEHFVDDDMAQESTKETKDLKRTELRAERGLKVATGPPLQPNGP